ncbi:hypothetical protein DXB23_04060 [Dorea sp. OM02-2LB]|nr:hypothetical protein DXB23_04060 [Dorea sp. OM02-2LB]
MKTIILPQKVATGTAYACLRLIERYPSSSAHARSQKVLRLRIFPYAFLLQKLKLYLYNSHMKFDLKEVPQYQVLRDFFINTFHPYRKSLHKVSKALS